MKIFVFGSTGMLGRYVSTYFKLKNFDVIDINRKDFNDLSLTNSSDIMLVLKNKDINVGDVVINCIGIIKQRNGIDDLDFININSVFPRKLANICELFKVNMLQPSSDCCFDGLRGKYSEEDSTNAIDVYGKTKALGEPSNATVIRTSIIGEELKNKMSFIEFVKSNKNKTVNGYTNHIWNGITCLEFVKICEDIINENMFWKGVKHVFTENSINKYDLVKLVSETYKLNVNVIPLRTPIKCDRSLITIRNNINIIVPDYKTQLKELFEYNYILNLAKHE